VWKYEKILQYPVNIKSKDLKMANSLITQFGGANGELSAALRYFTQSFSMPTEKAKAVLIDIATEELAHIEIIATMVNQLIKNATVEELKQNGLQSLYAEHGSSIFPTNADGVPFTASYFSSQGDYIANLVEDLAAESKAKATYEQLMDLTNDTDILSVLAFLREREIVHFQRFGELLNDLQNIKKNKGN
jgi:spore coat protein JC